ncbi:efflux RND transporter periplasmic adaptor subunit [Leptospira sp. 96542]|nr:efflux RND transporter periplasmic adaptor subunit [Leptospira sp. 96542]
MKNIIQFFESIPYLKKIIMGGLIYLILGLIYSNCTWESIRIRMPLITKGFYSNKLSILSIYKNWVSENNKTELKAELIEVKIKKIEYTEEFPKIESSAILEPIQKIDIFSKVSGRIEKIFVKDGEQVFKGQKLAKLDTLSFELDLLKQRAAFESALSQFNLTKSKLENAEKQVEVKLAEIEKRKALLERTKNEYSRMLEIQSKKKNLYDNGVISLEELETINLEVNSKFTNVHNALKDLEMIEFGYRDIDITNGGLQLPLNQKQRLQIFKNLNTKIERSEVEVAEKNIEVAKVNIKATEMLIKEGVLVSPSNGYVSKINHSPGELVTAGGSGTLPILTIVDISKLVVVLSVNEKDLSNFKVGQDTLVSIENNTGTPKNAKVKRINPLIDSKTHTAEVKIELNNRKLELRPGMFVRSETIVGSLRKLIKINAEAIQINENQNASVYVIRENRAFSTSIELSEKVGEDYVIKRGLKEGDEVAMTKINLLYDGVKVKANN